MEIENLNLQRQIDELSNWQNTFLDTIYPIGSIYMSIDSTNPSSLFGGAWEPWGTGKVPVGVDLNDTDFNTVEKTGGEKTHTLSVNEMPSHTHMLHLVSTQLGNGGGMWGTTYSQYDGNVDTYSTGGSQAHNNLQPYITCYMWKRITPSFTLEYTDRNSTHHSETILSEEELKTRIQEIKTFQEGQTVYMNLKTCKIISNGLKIKDCTELFRDCQALTSVDLSDFDTSETTTMESMFYACNSLQEINLNGINTSKVKNMKYMFGNCYAISQLNLSMLDTSQVTDMSNMFYECMGIEKIDMSKCITTNLTNTKMMFYIFADEGGFRGKINEIDISSMDFSKVTQYDNMFGDIPSNCLIYVKDQTSKNFILNIRNDFTNIQIANNQE